MVTLRDAFRSLRATPLVTAVAVASLMRGIGGHTAARLDPAITLRRG